MIVCVCEGINDTRLRRVIREGCGSVADLARRTRAGTHCGACACDLERLIAEARANSAPVEEALLVAAK